MLGLDRVNYLKILPQHFAEVLCLPENIRHRLEKGGFVCNIRGTKMHAVAPDEAHEMLVNTDIKTMQCSQALQRIPQPHHVLITLLEPRSTSSSKSRSPHLADLTVKRAFLMLPLMLLAVRKMYRA